MFYKLCIWRLETCSRNCLFPVYLVTWRHVPGIISNLSGSGDIFAEFFISNLSRDWKHVLESVYFETGNMYQGLFISNLSGDLETCSRACLFPIYLETEDMFYNLCI